MRVVMHVCGQHLPRWSSRIGPTDETRQTVCHLQDLTVSARKADSVLLEFIDDPCKNSNMQRLLALL